MALIDAALRTLVVAILLPRWRHARHAGLVRVGIPLSLSIAVQAVSTSPWIEHQLSCAARSPGIGLRLADAQRRLADPAQRALPVLTIALDVGFGSVGPFNCAFKADAGLTPTEFRQLKLADS